MSSVLIYGDTSANIVDGSSIWLSSITEVMSRVVDDVHVLLKYRPQGDTLLAPMRALPGVTLHAPHENPPDTGPDPTVVSAQAGDLASRYDVDAVIVRGLEVSISFSDDSRIASRLWAYVTDLPFPLERLSQRGQTRLNRLASRSRRMFSQTESSRSYLEAIAQMAAGKTVLMPPMVPDDAFQDWAPPGQQDVLRLIYSGKFAREWRIEDMLQLPRALETVGIHSQMSIVGAKFNKTPAEPGWPARMRAALERAHEDPASGVTWVGGLSRYDSLHMMAASDIGIGWRTEALDSSLEISTKVLEYGATGAVPLMNETQDHRRLYSREYPLFVAADDSLLSIAEKIRQALPRLPEARSLARRVSKEYTMAKAVERIKDAFAAAGIPLVSQGVPASVSPPDGQTTTDPPMDRHSADTNEVQTHQAPRPLNLLVASHDLKFMGEVLDHLRAQPSVHVAIDTWHTLHSHDALASERLLAQADVVLCEFGGPNLRWYSQKVKDEQRLVVRFHGFELRGASWLSQVNVENIDTVLVVSEHYKAMAVRQLGVPHEKVVVLPNLLDVPDLRRPKEPGAEFRLGLVGWAPFLKRPDRAVELLHRILPQDNRYTLHIRGKPPWEHAYIWTNPVEQQLYLDMFRKIREWGLRDRVVFEGFGADMGSWFRKIGVILSTSDHESFHLAPAEGMASGAFPIVWEREGAEEVFGDEYVVSGVESAAERVLRLRKEWRAESVKAGRTAARRWDSSHILMRWREILVGSSGSVVEAFNSRTAEDAIR